MKRKIKVTKKGNWGKLAAAGLVFVLLLVCSASTLKLTGAAETLPTVRILADGSVEPADVPIQRSGDLYAFTGNVYAALVVGKENVVIDGAGYTLQGTYNGTRTDSWEVGQGPDQEPSNGTLWTMGVDFDVVTRPNNVTVKNLNIQNFYIGMYVWTSNNTVDCNAVSDNIVGIMLSGDSNNITNNYVTRNDQGIFFGVNTPGNTPLNILLCNNSFVDNNVQFSGCFCETENTEEPMHTWDDGGKGNYWSDYTGTDQDGDGMGDTPYVIDYKNEDRYPLMQSIAEPPQPNQGMPLEGVVAAGLAALIAAVVAVVAIIRRKAAPKT